jgi:hypothetical protein
MANIQIKDANGDIKYLKMTGLGTDLSPYVPVQDVNVQDQHTRLFNKQFRTNVGSSTLGLVATPGDKTITVVDGSSFVLHHTLNIFNVAENTQFDAIVTDVTANVITFDTPIDTDFDIGDSVVSGVHDLHVDGSGAPVDFYLLNGDPGLTRSIDITRIMIMMITTATCTWSKFGDQTALTEGIVLRKKLIDGTYENIFNIKSNADIGNMAYDIQFLTGVGDDGLTARLTLGGQGKMGVVVRLAPGEDLELLVQDDAQAILHLHVYAQGHEVAP